MVYPSELVEDVPELSTEEYLVIEDSHIIPGNAKHPLGGIRYDIFTYMDTDDEPTNGFVKKIRWSEELCVEWIKSPTPEKALISMK